VDYTRARWPIRGSGGTGVDLVEYRDKELVRILLRISRHVHAVFPRGPENRDGAKGFAVVVRYRRPSRQVALL